MRPSVTGRPFTFDGTLCLYMSKEQPLFETNVLPILSEVIDTFTERGTQYADTWKNCRWLALIATLRKIGDRFHYDIEELRAISAAALVDIKYSRLEGGYKEDSAIDAIAYYPNWVAQMRKVEEIKLEESE